MRLATRLPSPYTPLIDALQNEALGRYNRMMRGRIEGVEAGFDMAGWTHGASPSCQSDNATGLMVAGGAAVMCGTKLTYDDGFTVYDTYRHHVTQNTDSVHFLIDFISFTQGGRSYTQGHLQSNWQRIHSTNPIPYNEAVAAQLPSYEPHAPSWGLKVPLGLPMLYPQLDPFTDPQSLPGNPFVDTPPNSIPYRSLPARKPNPRRSPSEQDDRGPRNNPRTRPGARPGSSPAPYSPPGVGTNPQGYPQVGGNPQASAPNVSVGPNGAKASAPGHRREPPKRNEKEDKVRALGPVASAISKAFQEMTEINDAIDSLYDSIPAKYRMKYRPGKPIADYEKAIHVAKNWMHVDTAKALTNIIKNQAEDKVIGGLNANAAKIPRLTGGIPVGIGYGPGL